VHRQRYDKTINEKTPKINQGLFKRDWNLKLSLDKSTKAGFSGFLDTGYFIGIG
jgi:hypothetical protein